MKTPIQQLALAAMLAALAATILCLGGIIPIALYVSPILASLAVLLACEECSMRYALACYGAAAALGVLLSPDKESALLFAFLGYYPLLKPRLDALRAVPRILGKLVVFLLSVGAMYALLIFVFQLEAVVQELQNEAPWTTALAGALGLALFFLYDRMLDRLAAIYRARRGRKKK